MKRRFKAEGGLVSVGRSLVAKDGVLEVDDTKVDPQVIAKLEALAASPSHPLYEAEPESPVAKKEKE